MNIIVDTCVWSYALRYKKLSDNNASRHSAELLTLISESRVSIIGPIRQELLSGIKDETQFNLLREKLSTFPDTELYSEDYEIAARFFNLARSRGIQGSNTDFLICAVANRLKYPLYTTDKDFELLAGFLPLNLYSPRDSG
jgi:predicted nucleic acid-binding protein